MLVEYRLLMFRKCEYGRWFMGNAIPGRHDVAFSFPSITIHYFYLQRVLTFLFVILMNGFFSFFPGNISTFLFELLICKYECSSLHPIYHPPPAINQRVSFQWPTKMKTKDIKRWQQQSTTVRLLGVNSGFNFSFHSHLHYLFRSIAVSCSALRPEIHKSTQGGKNDMYFSVM